MKGLTKMNQKLDIYTVIKNNNQPVRQYKINTLPESKTILVESNVTGYELIKMFYPFTLHGCVKLDSKCSKFESVDQINKIGFSIFITELENNI
jgi:hypothetical protein